MPSCNLLSTLRISNERAITLNSLRRDPVVIMIIASQCVMYVGVGRSPLINGKVLMRNSRTDAVQRLLQKTQQMPQVLGEVELSKVSLC